MAASKRKASFKAERERIKALIGAYRRRHRTWVMEAMPGMNDAQWTQYQEWVAAFGANFSRHQRKVKQQLASARDLAQRGATRTTGDHGRVYSGAVSGRSSGSRLTVIDWEERSRMLILKSGRP